MAKRKLSNTPGTQQRKPVDGDRQSQHGKQDVKTAGSKATTTRAKLVDAAMQLFHEKGYEATAVAEILERAGVNSGSLYYYFKTKEELLLAVLEHYKELLWPIVIQPVFDRTADPMERIWGILAGYRQMLLSSNFTAGCPIGNLALEMAVKSERARIPIAENFEGWRRVIRQLLVEAADRFMHKVDPDALATFILTTMEGGVMQARAYKSIAPFDASVTVLRDFFDLIQSQERTQAT